MSDFEQRSIDLQSQILAETQKQTRIETEFYATRADEENKVKTTFITIKETLRELFFYLTPIFPFLLASSKTLQKAVLGIGLTIAGAAASFEVGFRMRQEKLEKEERFRQKGFEKFLVNALKFTVAVELIKGFFKIQLGFFKRFVLAPIMGLGKILGINKLLAVPLKAIQSGVEKLGSFIKDNLLKLALIAGGLLYFFKTDNKFVAGIRKALDESLSSLVSKLFNVEDQGGFLSTFDKVWSDKWLPTLNAGWDKVVAGIEKWWTTPVTGGKARLIMGWEIIKTGTVDWWFESGRPALAAAFDYLADQIRNLGKTVLDRFKFGGERESLKKAEDPGNIFQQLSKINDPRFQERREQLTQQFIEDGMKPFQAAVAAFEQVRFEPSYIDAEGNLQFGLSPRAQEQKEERDRLVKEGKLFFDAFNNQFVDYDPAVRAAERRKAIADGFKSIGASIVEGLKALTPPNAAAITPMYGSGFAGVPIIINPTTNVNQNIEAPTNNIISQSKKVVNANPILD